ncbi:iron (metal) dependent repressor, DtxR family [Peptoclostridium litorale DSM 5388]|uniref:Iron dependent repressor protein n=1 Tax=Peptoclostridium litorale DSM 5388 TaxID=1121324 RepID=A0A069REF1_PEPLI|nr:metal-dependent transcriptional regulator [Peptoclostridium litorale]KDR95416.1 iron dependent repressor protein [Peptoclostridium litorale DSM 5388]SIO19196.1 iron (metal) dependent repressor, DtxR family [Peptoclostridium litorale DSM 5388]
MSYNESVEMYLETIYILEKEHGHAHGVDIAEALGVSKASVSKAMKQLKAKDLVCKEVYGSITLTQKGRELSEKIYYNHQLITSFLEHSLGLTAAEASENACRMEHVVSEDMIQAIEAYFEKNAVKIKK